MTNNIMKKLANYGVACEQPFGYVQAVKVRDTIYISRQLSHFNDGSSSRRQN